MLLMPLPPETLIACHLDAKDLPAVAEARALALEHTGRVEAAPILPKLAETFYESPYTDPRRWAQDLCELQEIFYEAKKRTEWPDAVLLARLQTLLLELLAEQVKQYTKGESTSVPANLARELMASLVLTLGLPGSGKALLHADPHAALAAGQRRLQTRWALAMQLHALAVKTAPTYQNLALRESLQSIADARRAYDVRLFAHQLPCSLDYPLLAPPPEDPPGPDYLAAWLRQVIAENRILARLEPFRVQILLARCCPDYQGQLVNLCEPAAVNLLGRAVLGLPPLALTLTDAHRAALRHTKAAPLHEAAERLAKEFDMDAPTLHAVARTLAARIPQGHLENVFL